MLADKYDMSRSLQAWTSQWMERAMQSGACDDVDELLRTAYCLDSVGAFSRISWKLICDHEGPFHSSGENEDVPGLPSLQGMADPFA